MMNGGEDEEKTEKGREDTTDRWRRKNGEREQGNERGERTRRSGKKEKRKDRLTEGRDGENARSREVAMFRGGAWMRDGQGGLDKQVTHTTHRLPVNPR